jgi:hypothetical protein
MQRKGHSPGSGESEDMPRLLASALAVLLLALPTVAFGQTTADPSGGASDLAPCGESVDPTVATSATAVASDSGSGGTPVATPGSSPVSDGGTGTSTSVEGDATPSSSGGGDVPLADAAQPEPEPEPEGPGEEQPEEPGGEPQEPTGEEPTGEAPAAEQDTGGGLPQTGLEALQLALLGLVLVLVGARLRAIAKRRRNRPQDSPEPDEVETGSFETAELGADGLPLEPAVEAYHEEHLEEHDEWSFPDPEEPAPTGLLPSTAGARRRARLRERDPD